MNDSSISDQTKSRFAEVVSNYAPTVPDKWQQLLALKSGIAELRHKRASYRTIAGILKNLDVSVSRNTVARFCREVLERSHPQPKNGKPMLKPFTQIPRETPHVSQVGKVTTQGPRIADPKTI